MVVLLRSRRRLRCLLGLALLAWSLLVVAPFGTPQMAFAHLASTAQVGIHHASMPMADADCCDGHASQADSHATQPCHCALPCAGVLPAMPARLAVLPMIPADYAPPRPIEAPMSGFTPPLRPPLA